MLHLRRLTGFKATIMANKKQHIETIAVHGAHQNSSYSSDIIQPIHLSTTFERKADGSLNNHVYTRISNPNRLTVENKIAALEEAVTAIAFCQIGFRFISPVFDGFHSGSFRQFTEGIHHGRERNSCLLVIRSSDIRSACIAHQLPQKGLYELWILHQSH